MVNKTRIYHNIHRIFASAWRRRYVILLPMLVLPVLAVFVGISAPKQYLSHTTVLIQETTKLNPFLQDFSVSTQLNERMAGLKALLHSRHMLLAVAQDLGRIESAEDPRAEAVVRSLSSSLSVRLIGADMIEVSYRSAHPEDMVPVLEIVTEHFLMNLLAPERSSVNASETFLQEQLALQAESLVSAETNLANYKAKNSAKLPNQYRFDVEQLRQAEASLREKQTELAGAQAKTSALKSQLLKTNPLTARVEEQLLALNNELSLLKTRYTDRHSKVIAVNRELARWQEKREQIEANAEQFSQLNVQQLWHLASELSLSDSTNQARPLLVSQLESLEAANAQQQQLSEEIVQLESYIAQLSDKLESFAGVEQQLLELERDIATKQSLYNDFLKRYELAKVTGALGRYEEGDRVKVIDQPYTPATPINPGWIIYLVAGILGGIAFGCGIALMLEVSDTRVCHRESLENLTGLPVLTRIPKVMSLAARADTTRTHLTSA